MNKRHKEWSLYDLVPKEVTQSWTLTQISFIAPCYNTVSPTCCVLGGRAVQPGGQEAGAGCAEAGGGSGGPVHLRWWSLVNIRWHEDTDLVWGSRHPPPSVSIAPELYQQSAIWKQREISILIKVNIVHWTTTYIESNPRIEYWCWCWIKGIRKELLTILITVKVMVYVRRNG